MDVYPVFCVFASSNCLIVEFVLKQMLIEERVHCILMKNLEPHL